MFDRAERERTGGRLWRAREILEGSLPILGYDVELYERLGVVLLEMGDLPRAGMFLFLSGARRDDYQEAIEVYRRRHSRCGPRAMFAGFPRAAKRSTLSEYPVQLASELRGLDFPEELRAPPLEPTAVSSGAFGMVACLTGALFLVAVLVAGFVKIAELLAGLGG